MSVTALRHRRDDSVSRWVCFGLGEQLYGLPIAGVQEVLRPGDIESVPGTAPVVLGVINLRGNVVTVLDLRLRLGLPSRPLDADSRIVVIEHGGETFGLLVDRVADVRKIPDAAVKPAPQVGAGASLHSEGVYSRDGEILTLLASRTLITDARFLA
ncbi:MAG TPA: chemotaxis protein CheW [Solimonas sp.]|jgi:purine-binding chemotaxis protein CheW|nr:chemotaxis protein CheW [Solimonas sp.]